MLLQTENKIYHLIRAMRPRQWVKNTIVFAPAVFQGKFFEPYYFYRGLMAFICFSLIASAIYLLNDCKDIKSDRAHPIKRDRPIASGALSKAWALTVAFFIIFTIIPISFTIIGKYFGAILVAYIILQIAYILKLKEIIIVDALTISLGFILRVFAGALAIPLSISSWLILAVTGLALLLAFGKRRAERTLLKAKGISETKTRVILKHYPDTLLDSMISMSASFAIITYSLFTFQVSPEKTIGEAFGVTLPSTLIGAKLLMLTVPIVIYGVGRYLYLIYEMREGESPERVLINDKPLLASILLWGFMVLIIND